MVVKTLQQPLVNMTSRFSDSAELRPYEASEGPSWNCSTVLAGTINTSEPCYIGRHSNLPDFVPNYLNSSLVPLQRLAFNDPALVYVSRHPCLDE